MWLFPPHSSAGIHQHSVSTHLLYEHKRIAQLYAYGSVILLFNLFPWEEPLPLGWIANQCNIKCVICLLTLHLLSLAHCSPLLEQIHSLNTLLMSNLLSLFFGSFSPLLSSTLFPCLTVPSYSCPLGKQSYVASYFLSPRDPTVSHSLFHSSHVCPCMPTFPLSLQDGTLLTFATTDSSVCWQSLFLLQMSPQLTPRPYRCPQSRLFSGSDQEMACLGSNRYMLGFVYKELNSLPKKIVPE